MTLTISLATTSWTKSFAEITFELSAQLLPEIPPPLSREALSFLNQQFEAEIVTHGWPGDTQYRFVNGDQRILIWANHDEADWHLTAETEESLERLVNSVGGLDSVVSAYGPTGSKAKRH